MRGKLLRQDWCLSVKPHHSVQFLPSSSGSFSDLLRVVEVVGVNTLLCFSLGSGGVQPFIQQIFIHCYLCTRQHTMCQEEAGQLLPKWSSVWNNMRRRASKSSILVQPQSPDVQHPARSWQVSGFCQACTGSTLCKSEILCTLFLIDRNLMLCLSRHFYSTTWLNWKEAKSREKWSISLECPRVVVPGTKGLQAQTGKRMGTSIENFISFSICLV